MEKLRITEIQISNLFEELSYDIKLPLEKPISIITAPNGRGKTTLLNLISFVFDPGIDSFKLIRSVPFDFFRCTLSNGKIVELKKENLESIEKYSKTIKSAALRESNVGRIRAIFDNSDFIFTVYDGNKKISEPIDFAKVFLSARDIELSELFEDDDEDYSVVRSHRSTMYYRYRYLWKLIQDCLHDYDCFIPVKFIKADRIQPLPLPPSRMREFEQPKQISPLEDASDKIGKRIKEATDNYYNEVSLAKDKLPEMFIEDNGGDLESDDFIDQWSDYRKELTQFQDIGLITPTKDFTEGKNIREVYSEKGKFLSTYIWAFKDTTDPLKDIYARLNLFKSILDERNEITGKKVSFSPDGVKIHVGDRELSLETLSSGEKHDFIMFYDLILAGDNNGLMLIDEPEISLHIEWQESYLDKLLKICEMNNFQFIIATHSPNIVSSHYDFLVDKGEVDG